MEKIKIIQIGMCHEHANGKIEVLKRRSDIFDLIGYPPSTGPNQPRIQDLKTVIDTIERGAGPLEF